MSQVFTEPHSIKQREDGVSWGLDTDGVTLALTQTEKALPTVEDAEATCRGVRCPVLVVHGTEDRITPYEVGVDVARWTGGRLVTIEGGGHAPPLREPVLTNRLIADFVGSLVPESRPPLRWARARQRPKRALYVCSPIGLGHVRRDLAIADELRRLHPDLRDRLAHPATGHPGPGGARRAGAPGVGAAGQRERAHRVRGRRARPARLPGDPADGRDPGRQLHGLRRPRRPTSPTTSGSSTRDGTSTHFLHDNPELKRTPYAWLTDFTGWLPMADGGDAEARLTADWNAERVERGRRYPRLRDRSIFVGNEADLVDRPLGPGPADRPRLGVVSATTSRGTWSGAPPSADRDEAARRARVRPGRAGLRRHRRRLGSGRAAAAPCRRTRSRSPRSRCRGCGWCW